MVYSSARLLTLPEVVQQPSGEHSHVDAYTTYRSRPQDTARVARAAFPKGNVYMEMRDVLGTIYDDEDFSELFEVRTSRHHAVEVGYSNGDMQFSEGLSDRRLKLCAPV